MNMLRNGLKEVEREVEFYRGQQTTGYDGDRYLPVMKEFHAKASVRLAELEDLFIDMKARVSQYSVVRRGDYWKEETDFLWNCCCP